MLIAAPERGLVAVKALQDDGRQRRARTSVELVDKCCEHREAGGDRRENCAGRDGSIDRVDNGRPVEESAGTWAIRSR